MKGPFQRGADPQVDERLKRRLREIAERADAAEPAVRPLARAVPVPIPRAATGVPREVSHTPTRVQQASPPHPAYAPPAQPPFTFQPPQAAAKPRRHLLRRFALGLVAFILILLVIDRIKANGPQGWTSKADPDHPLAAWPEPPSGIESAPLGAPPTDVPAADTYLFLAEQPDSGEPVTYDPCAPIHYVVNDRTAFDGALEEVDAAIAEIEKATGLVFVNDGPTDEAPVEHRAFQDKHYGKSWSPVLVSWSDGSEYDGLEGTVVGRGGSSAISQNERRWFVTGSAVFDGPQLRRIYRMKDGPAQVRAVIMHELGHVVGLDHVSDRGEIMKPAASRETTTWGPGDRAGLAQLGDGHCITY